MGYLEQLVQQGHLERHQIDEILERAQKEFAGDVEPILLELRIDPDVIMAAKSNYYGIPSTTFTGDSIPFTTLQYIPQDSAQHYRIVPLAVSGDMLTVGIVDPGDTEARNALQFISTNKNISFELELISPKQFERLVQGYQGATGEVTEAMSDFEKTMFNVDEESTGIGALDDAQAKSPINTEVLRNKIVEDAPVTKMVAVILRHAIEGRASDIHIENNGDKVKVRFRVDGVLHTSLILPKTVHDAVVARVKILSKLKLDERRRPQDGRFPAKIEGRKIDFRVSTFPTAYGEKVVIRILDPNRGVNSLDGTGMRPDHMAMVKEAISRPYGMILITGPTGSGKSTTLYSMLKELDREKFNVVSLEDPVEYNVPGVSQSQVHPEIGYTFANGLRSILRQDPDIIMVGEIRDKETAQLAIQAALTGHLVFSTLHTNNSIGVIPRLIDMDVDPYLIAPTLQLVVAQRLVKKMCAGAQKKVEHDESIAKIISEQFADAPASITDAIDLTAPVYEAGSSRECPNGLRGRMAVYEMFNMNSELEQLILENPSDTKIYELMRSKGLLTMKEDAILKSMAGQVPFTEVYNL